MCGPGQTLELKVTDTDETLCVYLYDQTESLACGLLNSIITPSASSYWRSREWLHILFTNTKMFVEEYSALFVCVLILNAKVIVLIWVSIVSTFCLEVSLYLFFRPLCWSVLDPRLLN